MKPRTHLAVRAVGHGRLEFTRLPVAQPAVGQVRIRVEASGICRLDSGTVEGTFPGLVYPRIPGHEVIGRIEARGVGVSDYAIGQRVAVGMLACGPILGASVDGGYAETMIAHQNALVAVPVGLNSIEAAPLLCGGLTIYRALRRSRARLRDVVAVCGVDPFGQLALQFARQMGFQAVVVDREESAPLLLSADDAVAIIAASSSELQIASPSELRDVLEFSVAKKIRPLVETTSLVETSDVYRRVISGTAAFRVIDTRFLNP